ncbi:MAG: hypothetical protein KF801_05630 [Cryobacterium sp.]|jgi:hypothetical protein|nr:hypothetical protein [Cryobacterium sp.]
MEATLQHEVQRESVSRESSQRPVRRVGLVDRAALHVGVALVAWGRRPVTVESRERRANRVELHLAALGRELAAERMHYLEATQR